MAMATISSTLLFFLFWLHAIMTACETTFGPDFGTSKFCDSSMNYTANSTFSTNLHTLLSTLTSHKEINYGFYNFSHGQNSDKVYAIGLCRGDLKVDECRSCINSSQANLRQLCPNQKEAIKWEEKCMLRYSNRPIFHTMETSPPYYTNNDENATKVDEFNKVLGGLLRNLREKAAGGDSRRKYATDTAFVDNFQPIHGLMQCTPDLSRQDCGDCLDWSISAIPTFAKDKVGALVLLPSCNLRFEIYNFYNSTVILDPPLPPASLPLHQEDHGNSLRTAIIIVVPTVIVVLVLLIVISRYLRRKARKNLLAEDGDDDEIEMVESLQFNLSTIQVATSNFSDSNKLGEGGFGSVYQGKLSNGQVIAVKRLSRNSGQGDLEFKNEVLLLAKLQHRNLVRLLGFSLQGREKLLVYEFVPNKSLDYFIFDPTEKAQLDWDTRYKIIKGIARGLLYLHQDSRLRIIHRDLKASNILLDKEMIPKISDFGLARLITADQTQENTSRVVGTFGYMAPEYIMQGQFSVKSDVFSFGVLVLEIVSGQKNHGVRDEKNGEDLLSFVWRNWIEGTVTNIIDPTLKNSSQNEMIRCIGIGLLCVEEDLNNRPTMANVALMLNSCSITLPVPKKPAFFIDSATGSLPNMSWEDSWPTRGTQSSGRSAQESVNEASITELYPR
ncbi:cysteine-rich receptor-like protein kinase 10 isoform X2 [Phaseolus vulgaris]|uniref:cysteine-rich receptor-like protein kinase 10 isoform X2 n=1 Tax=Phaseolus vulgaris TaxID=3885 RepID=UPI0035C9A6E8